MVVLAEMLLTEKAGPYSYYASIPGIKKKIAAPSIMEGVQWNQLATGGWLGPSGGCCHIGNSALVYAVDMLTHWTISNSSQSNLGEGTSMLLGSRITSTPINRTTLLMSKLWSKWGKKLTAITDLIV